MTEGSLTGKNKAQISGPVWRAEHGLVSSHGRSTVRFDKGECPLTLLTLTYMLLYVTV